MLQKHHLFIQNIESILSYVEPELLVVGDDINKERFYQYLIGITLFKTGGWNTNYVNEQRYDEIREHIKRNLINQAGIRYLDNLILSYVIIPKSLGDMEITLQVKGDLLFVRYQYQNHKMKRMQ